MGVVGTVSHADLSALSTADLTHMIHILDTEHPWEVHSVSSGHSEAITCLEWDQSGEAMRAGDAAFLRAWEQPPLTESAEWGGSTQQFTCLSEGPLTHLFCHRVPTPVC